MFVDDKGPSTLVVCAPSLGVSGARTRNSKPGIGIVFVGDKDPSIEHNCNYCY